MRGGLFGIGIVMALIISLMSSASPALASIQHVSADARALSSNDGRYAMVSGPIVCDVGNAFRINLTMAQESTGAQAAGTSLGVCVGDVQLWTAQLRLMDGYGRIDEGTALVCLNVLLSYGNGVTEVQDQCLQVTVLPPMK
jgi:hypothetical protein